MKQSKHEALSKLVSICQDELTKNKKIYAYLKQRKITDETIEKFKLGAFPSDLRILFKDDIDAELLKDLGIIYNASKSPYKNMFPLIIPIQDVYGQFIGIGGRTLLSEEERNKMGIIKYRNSVYEKTKHCFGLYQAKDTIRKKDQVVIVEGYFDVISSHQAGMQNVVATSGTILSIKQVNLLSRYTENLKAMFDNDEPGQMAAHRFISKRAKDGIKITEGFVPKGYKDLDEYWSNKGIETIKKPPFDGYSIETLW
jgi:DNA primase